MTEGVVAEPLATPDGASSVGIGRRLVKSSSWMIGMRLGVRGVGFLSTVILARVLTPADFGIVAMAMIVISFIEVFSETGQQQALIRHPAPRRAHYDSAWTMTVLVNSGLTLILLAIAPYATLYFHDPRIVPVIRVLSLRIFLGGFLNIGVVDFRRSLNFARDFQFGLTRKLLTFGVTITLALTWHSYWALVLGTVWGNFLEVALSYTMQPYRPRFDFSCVRELWSFSIWILVSELARYFEGRVDEVVVAGVAPSAGVGTYTVGAELGALPITEIQDPIGRALFPNYARLAHDPALLRHTYLQVLSAFATLATAVGVGIALVAPDLVAVLLGRQWIQAVPIVAWFAVAAAITGTCNTVFAVLNACGESRLSAIQSWIRVALFIPAMVWAAHTGVLINFAIAKLIVSGILIPTFFVRLRQIMPVKWSELGRAVWRPPLAAGAMALGLIGFDHAVTLAAPPVVRLVARAGIGAAIFIAAQLLLWYVAGRPQGLEHSLLKELRRRGWRGRVSQRRS